MLSDDIPNALRSVVVGCSVEPFSEEFDLRLPTYALLSPAETGLDSEAVATPGSPFTIPKNALVERRGFLPRKAQNKVDAALRLVFGYTEWPI